MKRFTIICACLAFLAPAIPGFGQWDPANGQWGKQDPNHIRVMTWNVEDGICRTNNKTEAANNWTALTMIVAAMRPDVLILQETGDNSGNGTGSGVDSVSQLATTIDLFFHGGTDPFLGGTVTAFVQKYAPGYDLPHVFVSGISDGFNRNVIVSRFPFVDLNGDGTGTRNDIYGISADAYAPGGNGGIRGYQFAELDLPDETYLGDLVIGNGHLKAGGSSSDLADRLEASQNIAYFIDYWYNGAGTGIPDPNNKISDFPAAATTILDANTPIIWGGDWNEDEVTNGRKGPAEWMTRAQFTGGTDGTDRDRTDSMFDLAVSPVNGDPDTIGSSKFDYLAWQDSIASLQNEFIFDTRAMQGGAASFLPPEIQGFPGFPGPHTASLIAADHNSVVIDVSVPTVPQGPQVIISEIMYNPASSEASPNDVEWVEIYNVGNAAANLEDWYLADEDGATGPIPAGASLDPGEAAVLIPADQTVADFQAAWGTGFDIYPLSNWNSVGLTSLGNDPSPTNEILTLRDAGDNVMDEVNYDDEGDWPSDVPDGPSIFLLPGALDAVSNDTGTNWARSVDGQRGGYVNTPTLDFDGQDVGSPGFVDTTPPECASDPDCDDGNVCTDDSCSPLAVCLHDPNTELCDDGDFCTTVDVCSGGVCVGGGPPPDCDDSDPCTDDVCQGGSCQHPFNTAPCDDGNLCTINDACESGTCAGTPVDCPPGEICDPLDGQCKECLDNADCDDNNVCTDDSCQSGSCVFDPNGNLCDDGDHCTLDDVCVNGACVGTPDTSMFGDVAPPGGNDIVDVDDILCVLAGFTDEALCPGADLVPCGGNGIVDVDDILAELAAFSGNDLCPCP